MRIQLGSMVLAAFLASCADDDPFTDPNAPLAELRVDLSGNPTFVQLLARVRQVCLDAFSHHALPFDRLVADLSPERDLRRNPLYQVSLALQNAPNAGQDFGMLEAQPMHGVVELDIDAEVVGVQLELVALEQSRRGIYVHDQMSDRAVEAQLPVAIAAGIRLQVDP